MTEPSPNPTRPARRVLSPGEIVWTALAAAFLTGLVEIGIGAVRRYLFHRFLWTSPDILWMAPLGYAVLFLLLGVGLMIVRLIRPVRSLMSPGRVIGLYALLG